MLFVVRSGREEQLMQRFRRWGLQAAVVGRVLEEPVVRVLQHGAVAAEVPARALAEDTPINQHELLSEPPEDIQTHWTWRESDLPRPAPDRDWNADLLRLLDDPTIASKRWIYRQYDQQVLANTVIRAGGADAAVIRLRPQQGDASLQTSQRGVAATLDCPNRWVALDPERGAIAAVAEAARNLSCVGAQPIAVTDNLNFPSPETPKGYWQLAMACRGLSHACRALGTPVTGGNVSLYNETRADDGSLQPIHPTPVVGMVGLVEDLDRSGGIAWRQPGDLVVMLGVSTDEEGNEGLGLAGSSYQGVVHGLLTGRPPNVDLELEGQVQALVRQAFFQGVLASAHDSSDGGLAVALAESALASGLGVDLNLPHGSARLDRVLFAEGGARIVVSVRAEQRSAWQALVTSQEHQSVPVTEIGTVADHGCFRLAVGKLPVIDLSVETLQEQYEQAVPRRLGAV
jgi:phosphoribosylformylglycinamidine synthase